MPSVKFGEIQKDDRLCPEQGGVSTVSSAASPRRQSPVRAVNASCPPSPKTALVPASPSPSLHMPSSPPSPSSNPAHCILLCKKCATSQAPPVARGRFDHLPFDQLHKQCKRRGRGRKGSKAVLKTRLASMGDGDRNRRTTGRDAVATSETVASKRDRVPAVAVEISEALIGN